MDRQTIELQSIHAKKKFQFMSQRNLHFMSQRNLHYFKTYLPNFLTRSVKKKICSHLTTDVVTWIAFEFVLNSTPCYSQSRYEFNKTYWGRLWCMRESSSMKSILNQNLWYLYVYWHTTDFRQWPFLLSALLHHFINT